MLFGHSTMDLKLHTPTGADMRGAAGSRGFGLRPSSVAEWRVPGLQTDFSRVESDHRALRGAP